MYAVLVIFFAKGDFFMLKVPKCGAWLYDFGKLLAEAGAGRVFFTKSGLSANDFWYFCFTYNVQL